MLNGVFSEILYQVRSIPLAPPERKMLLIGAPLIAIRSRAGVSESYLMNIVVSTGVSTTIGPASTGAEKVAWNKLKPYSDCHLFHVDNFTLYATWNAADGRHKEEVSASIIKEEYNDPDSEVGNVLTVAHNDIKTALGCEDDAVITLSFDITVARSSLYNKKYYVGSVEDLVARFGIASLDEPDSNLARGAYLASTVGTEGVVPAAFDIYCVDMSDYTGDDPAGYMNVDSNHTEIINMIKRFDNYYLVPLVKMNTYNAAGKTAYEAIIEAYHSHVTAQSSINVKKECRVYFAKPILNQGWGIEFGGEGYYIELPGSSLKDEDNYRDQAAVDVPVALNYPAKIMSDRVVLIGGYYAYYGTNKDLLEGCEIATLIAAYRASVPLVHSTSGEVVPMLTGLPHYAYFTLEQMNSLRNSGWYMLHQSQELSFPVCYRQTTTYGVVNQILERAEDNLPIVVDSLCRELRQNLKSKTGNGTANKIAKDPAAPASVAYIRSLNEEVTPIINRYTTGRRPLLADARIRGIRPNIDHSDQGDIVIEVRHLYYVNQINATITVVA